MNRAAEAAAPRAKDLVVGAVRAMTVEDALEIVRGGDDAATQYLRGKTEASLAAQFRPVVDSALAESGAAAAMSDVAARYDLGGFADGARGKLTDHVVAAALDGVFLAVAEEEAAIRSDPVRRTTDVLKRVFGG